MTMRSGKPPGANPAAVSGDRANVLARCLSLDLEVGRADERIHALAGVRPDTGQSLVIPRVGNNPAPALARLDDLADGADFVLGHNVIGFDLPHLRAANPCLRLLDLPAVDTLRLNPLAFPRNPYHHLVKHYQDGSLIRGRLNDPELDARLTLEVFDNQQKAFRDARPELLAAWHWLTTAEDDAGFHRFFSALRGAHRPSAAEAQDRHSPVPGGQLLPHPGPGGRDGCGTAGLGTCLHAGVAVGGRGQLGDAALGATPISWGWPTGSPAAG